MKTQSGCVEALRAAIEKEQRELLIQEEEFALLTAKVNQFEMGEGPPPSDEEFNRWIMSVDTMLVARSLKNGFALSAGSQNRAKAP